MEEWRLWSKGSWGWAPVLLLFAVQLHFGSKFQLLTLVLWDFTLGTREVVLSITVSGGNMTTVQYCFLTVWWFSPFLGSSSHCELWIRACLFLWKSGRSRGWFAYTVGERRVLVGFSYGSGSLLSMFHFTVEEWWCCSILGVRLKPPLLTDAELYFSYESAESPPLPLLAVE